MKKDISKAFAILRKHGFIVLNFNFNKRISKWTKGFVDHLFIHPYKGICFVEVKIGKDVLSDEQQAIKTMLQKLSVGHPIIYYRIVKTEEEAKQLVDFLLGLPR